MRLMYKIVDCFRAKKGFLIAVLNRDRELTGKSTNKASIDGKEYIYHWQHILSWIGLECDEDPNKFIGKIVDIIQD